MVQGSDEWFAARAGRPTASNFSKMVTSKGTLSKSIDDYAITLAGDLFAGKPLEVWQGNQWTDRGHELEPCARTMYAFMHDVEVEEVGFIEGDDWGCSPDGLIGNNGMLEIKCLKPENHIKMIMWAEKNNGCPTTYVQQVQGQMLVAGAEYCDLVFYHPDLPVLIIRNEPDPEIVKGLLEAKELILTKRDEIVATLRNKI